MASAVQLEFSQAMSDFKNMFPDMDREVIEAVLRANQGAVDQTIDQLLAMSTDNQNEKLRNELDATGSPQHSLINLNDSATNLRQPAISVTATATAGALATTAQKKQTVQLMDTTDVVNSNPIAIQQTISTTAATVTLLTLNSGGTNASPHHNTGASPKQRPQQFSILKTTLPLNQNVATISAKRTFTNTSCRWQPPILGSLPPGFLRITPTGAQHEFDLPDEQFALMLQNEEFMNQLRWNQEFMNALEKEQSGKAKTEDDAAFKERLKNMGKMSRKKFLQIARVFTWQRNKKVTTAKQIDSLPLKEEPSDDEEAQQQRQQLQEQQVPHQQPQVRK